MSESPVNTLDIPNAISRLQEIVATIHTVATELCNRTGPVSLGTPQYTAEPMKEGVKPEPAQSEVTSHLNLLCNRLIDTKHMMQQQINSIQI